MKLIVVLMVFLALFVTYNLWWTNGQVTELNLRLESLEEIDAKEIKLIGDLTSLVEALNEEGKDLRKTLDEVTVKRQGVNGRWDRVDQYAEAMSRYYATLTLIELDPGTTRDSLLRIADIVAFDPMLSAMWKEVMRNPDTFYLFGLVFNTHFYRALEEVLGQPEISSSEFNGLSPRLGDGVT